MGNAQKSAKYLYLSLLGALAVLCIAAGIWWFIRGQQRAEPQYLLKDNGGHPALYRRTAPAELTHKQIPLRFVGRRGIFIYSSL